jgi:hypothetical protein
MVEYKRKSKLILAQSNRHKSWQICLSLSEFPKYTTTTWLSLMKLSNIDWSKMIVETCWTRFVIEPTIYFAVCLPSKSVASLFMNNFRAQKLSKLKRSVNLVSTVASNFATGTGLLLVERVSTTFTSLGVSFLQWLHQGTYIKLNEN